MITLGIISDSHYKIDYLKECIDFLKQKECQYLVHAGDICTEDGLKLLEDSNLKYIAVFGNNDSQLLHLSSKYNIKKEPYCFKIKEKTFKLMHLPYYLAGDCDIVIFGHTHKFHIEYTNRTLFVNSGEVCAREKPQIECVKLQINENQYIITRYFKNIDENNFKEEVFKYEQ